MNGIGPQGNQGVGQPNQNINQSRDTFPQGQFVGRNVAQQQVMPQLSKVQGESLWSRIQGKLFGRSIAVHSPVNNINQGARASAAPSAQIYNDVRARLNIQQQRITQRFETPEKHIHVLKTNSASLQKVGLSHGGRIQNYANVKASKFNRLSGFLEAHKQNLTLELNVPIKEQQGREIIDNLEKGMKEIKQNLSSGKLSPQEQIWFTKMFQELDGERALVLQVMDDPNFSLANGRLDWQTCTELKRTGYDINTAILQSFGALNDQNVVAGSEVNFGSGTLHTVFKVTYNTSQGPVDLVFKPEDAFDTSPHDQIAGADNYFDKSRPKFAARNLAGLKIQKMLGLDLMPHMKMAMHNGKVGMLMEVAKGVQPYNHNKATAPDLPYDSPYQPGVSANIQKNLTGAEWLDGICGQQDRHPGNYFIDPNSGKVTLIDSDLAFYPGLHQLREPSHSQLYPGWSGSRASFPALIDMQLYSNLMNLNEDSLYQELGGLLEPREIHATVSRIRLLKQHAYNLDLQGRVVNNWQTWSQSPPPVRAADVLRDHPNEDSYFRNCVTLKNWAVNNNRLVAAAA